MLRGQGLSKQLVIPDWLLRALACPCDPLVPHRDGEVSCQGARVGEVEPDISARCTSLKTSTRHLQHQIAARVTCNIQDTHGVIGCLKAATAQTWQVIVAAHDHHGAWWPACLGLHGAWAYLIKGAQVHVAEDANGGVGHKAYTVSTAKGTQATSQQKNRIDRTSNSVWQQHC